MKRFLAVFAFISVTLASSTAQAAPFVMHQTMSYPAYTSHLWFMLNTLQSEEATTEPVSATDQNGE